MKNNLERHALLVVCILSFVTACGGGSSSSTDTPSTGKLRYEGPSALAVIPTGKQAAYLAGEFLQRLEEATVKSIEYNHYGASPEPDAVQQGDCETRGGKFTRTTTGLASETVGATVELLYEHYCQNHFGVAQIHDGKVTLEYSSNGLTRHAKTTLTALHSEENTTGLNIVKDEEGVLEATETDVDNNGSIQLSQRSFVLDQVKHDHVYVGQHLLDHVQAVRDETAKHYTQLSGKACSSLYGCVVFSVSDNKEVVLSGASGRQLKLVPTGSTWLSNLPTYSVYVDYADGGGFKDTQYDVERDGSVLPK